MMPISSRPGQCATPSHYGWIPPRQIRSIAHTPHGLLPHLVAPMLPQIRAAMSTVARRDELIASWLTGPRRAHHPGRRRPSAHRHRPDHREGVFRAGRVGVPARAQPLALLAIDRALRVDPDNPLPHLLYGAWLAGIAPDEIQALVDH